MSASHDPSGCECTVAPAGRPSTVSFGVWLLPVTRISTFPPLTSDGFGLETEVRESLAPR